MSERKIGAVILEVNNISLAFGGVKALTDISFDVREHEIRAIIGPNGAGKSSMLNCINGVYQPQVGSISLRGRVFKHMNSRDVALMGVARTSCSRTSKLMSVSALTPPKLKEMFRTSRMTDRKSTRLNSSHG